MKEKHVITNHGEIIAIVKSKEVAEHLAKFLPGRIEVAPISDWDFCYDQIKEFMK